LSHDAVIAHWFWKCMVEAKKKDKKEYLLIIAHDVNIIYMMEDYFGILEMHLRINSYM
jgi:ABC-type dipeptide/oligopeptide/nickel transport system ATPase subunit